MKKVTMKCIHSGKWEVLGISHWSGRVFAVLVCHAPRVYELQNEQGQLIFNDGFESLADVRAYLNMRESRI